MPENWIAAERRIVGVNQVRRAAEAGQLSRIYLASDADESLTASLRELCSKGDIALDCSMTRAELGSFCEIDVPSACAGILREEK